MKRFIMNKSNKFEKYQTDHLLLLIGTNPLPNYVAAELLAGPNTKIHWVVTKEMGDVEKRLAKAMGKLDKIDEYCILVDSTNPDDIFMKVKNRVEANSGSWGLHYTGGTKTMGIHARRGMEEGLKKGEEAVYSYLNAPTMCLVVEKYKNYAQCSDLKTQFDAPITLEKLLEMHGHRLNPKAPPPDVEPFQIELATILFNARLNEPEELKPFIEWVNTLPSTDNKQAWKDKAFLECSSPLLPATPVSGKSISEIKKNWGSGFKNPEKVVTWFKGLWFEEYIFAIVKSLQEQSEFKLSPVKSVKSLLSDSDLIKDDFEIDIVVMQGYRLFAISVTTDGKMDRCKQKLFEVLTRARQMGGDEARVALVCFSDEPEKIQKQVGDLMQMNSQVMVFGKKHIRELDNYLQDWFQQGIT